MNPATISYIMLADVDPLKYPGPAWSPYVVGALIGVLSMFTFYFSNKPLGASTAYARIAGILGNLTAPAHTRSLKYFDDKPPKVGWELMLVVGVIVGSFVSAWTGRELTGQFLPALWVDRFGPDSGFLRVLVAFAGGTLMAFGARMAGGCTSGHGVCGLSRFSPRSAVAVATFMAVGVLTVTLGRHVIGGL